MSVYPIFDVNFINILNLLGVSFTLLLDLQKR